MNATLANYSHGHRTPRGLQCGNRMPSLDSQPGDPRRYPQTTPRRTSPHYIVIPHATLFPLDLQAPIARRLLPHIKVQAKGLRKLPNHAALSAPPRPHPPLPTVPLPFLSDLIPDNSNNNRRPLPRAGSLLHRRAPQPVSTPIVPPSNVPATATTTTAAKIPHTHHPDAPLRGPRLGRARRRRREPLRPADGLAVRDPARREVPERRVGAHLGVGLLGQPWSCCCGLCL